MAPLIITFSHLLRKFSLIALAKFLFIASMILVSIDLEEILEPKREMFPLGTQLLNWKLWLPPWLFEALHIISDQAKVGLSVGWVDLY